MRAYILHLFTATGGGEKVSLEIARVLKERGFKVIYLTNSAEALKKVAKALEVPGDYETIEVNSLVERALGMTGRFVRYRRLLLLRKGLKKLTMLEKSPETMVIDTCTNYPFSVDVTYIHYPLTLSTITSRALHWKLYNWLVKRGAESMHGEPKIVLTNSTWTAELLKKTLGINTKVVHPPVDVDYFAYDWRKKENIIVTVSRFMPEKRLHLLPHVAAKLRDYEWYLVGSLGARGPELDMSKRVLRRVNKEVENLKIRNFHVITDISRNELRDLLLGARFYVHPQFAEHFGIAVAEAAAAGCIPLVYRDGGAWTDIVSPVSPELGYTTLNEVPGIIERLEHDLEKQERLRLRSVERSKLFRTEVFREKLVNIMVDHGLLR